MVTRRNWANELAGAVTGIMPRRLGAAIREDEITPEDVRLDALEKHDISVEQVHTATEWFGERMEDLFEKWEDAHEDYEEHRDLAKEAEGPRRTKLKIVGEDLTHEAEELHQEFLDVAAKWQFFRRVERHIESEIERHQFEEETNQVISDVDEFIGDLAEEMQETQRDEQRAVSRAKEALTGVEECNRMTPETDRIEEDIAEEELSDTELGVATGYGEDLLEDDDEDEEYRIDAGGETT